MIVEKFTGIDFTILQSFMYIWLKFFIVVILKLTEF